MCPWPLLHDCTALFFIGSMGLLTPFNRWQLKHIPTFYFRRSEDSNDQIRSPRTGNDTILRAELDRLNAQYQAAQEAIDRAHHQVSLLVELIFIVFD